MKKILLLAILATFGFARCAQQPSQKATAEASSQLPKANVDESSIISILYEDDLMIAAKAAVQANDPEIMPIYNRFSRYVDANFLNMEPLSIVEGKLSTAPSRDPRDWITQSPYWWPDPENPGGPYIRFDGVTNPETRNFPEGRVGGRVASGAQGLAFMYYITGDEKYAAKAAELLRHFLLDDVTGMNPNMYFSQHVPGMERIRGTGIISARTISGLLNAAKIIDSSQAWTSQDEADTQDWATAYAYWLENSTQGRYEKRGGNNHGTWFEASLQAVVLYTKDYEHLTKLVLVDQIPRIPHVLTADSVSPHEVARTRGLHYSTFMIQSIAQSVLIGEKIGFGGLWGYTGENGRNMSLVIDYLIQFWKDPSKWPYFQIVEEPYTEAVMILRHAGKQLDNQKYIDAAKELGINDRPNYFEVPMPQDVLYYQFTR